MVFVSNYKAIHHEGLADTIASKRIWASGTKTWLQLARIGLWVEGCADSFGLESLQHVWSLPIVDIDLNDIHVITNEEGAKHWQSKGWNASATYSFSPQKNTALHSEISEAEVIFWTSIHQYLHYKDILKKDVVHLSASGETATLLKNNGVHSFIFPTIKSFEQWRTLSIRPRCAV